METIDLTAEAQRTFVFHRNGQQVFYGIINPVEMKRHIPDSGVYRIVDEDGLIHHIPNGWVAIRVRLKD